MGNYVSGLLFSQEKVYSMEDYEKENNSNLKNIFFYFGNIYNDISGNEITSGQSQEDGSYNYHFHEEGEEN